MSLLTDAEINEIADKCKAFYGGVWPHAFYEYAEAIILAKLAGMELPECHTFLGKEEQVVTDTYVMQGVHYKKYYTEDQLRQAYAQGAASQLASGPSFWRYLTNGVHEHIISVCPPDDAYDEGTLTPLFTRKEPS